MLVEHLCQFTAKYAREVGAKAFLIRPLDYGNIPDFTSLEKIKIPIEKVGGYPERTLLSGRM